MKIKSNGGSNYDNCVLLKARGKKERAICGFKMQVLCCRFQIKINEKLFREI